MYSHPSHKKQLSVEWLLLNLKSLPVQSFTLITAGIAASVVNAEYMLNVSCSRNFLILGLVSFNIMI